MSSEIYADIILDYYRNPKNYGDLDDATIVSKDSNPLCGDVVEMQLKISKGMIVDVRFKGQGCAISVASASMLTELIKDKKLEEIIKLDKKDIFEMLNIELSPIRIKCALLPLKALKLGVYSYLGKNKHKE